MNNVNGIHIVMDSFDSKHFYIYSAICSILEKQINKIFIEIKQWCFSGNTIIINPRIYPKIFVTTFKKFNKERIRYSRKRSEIFISVNIDFALVANDNHSEIFKIILKKILLCLEKIKKHVIKPVLFEESVKIISRLKLPKKFTPPMPEIEIPE